MARGGKREGAGGKPGEKKVTIEMRFDILQSLKARGFDPLQKLLDCYDDADKLYRESKEHGDGVWIVNSRWQMRAQVAQELLKYVYPQRKAVELTGENGADLFQSFVEVIKQSKKEAEAIEAESRHV